MTEPNGFNRRRVWIRKANYQFAVRPEDWYDNVWLQHRVTQWVAVVTLVEHTCCCLTEWSGPAVSEKIIFHYTIQHWLRFVYRLPLSFVYYVLAVFFACVWTSCFLILLYSGRLCLLGGLRSQITFLCVNSTFRSIPPSVRPVRYVWSRDWTIVGAKSYNLPPTSPASEISIYRTVILFSLSALLFSPPQVTHCQ